MKNCVRCKIQKQLIDFHKNKSRKDGLQDICKLCSKERDKKSYKGRKDYYIKNNTNNIIRNRTFIFRYLNIFGKCIDCGIKDWRVLEFDHKSNKLYNISDLVSKANSLLKIKKEIKKCEIRCANCHRIKTRKLWNTSGKWANR